MKKYSNCRTFHTGIFAPHTIEIDGRLVSIDRGDAASVVDYYTNIRGLAMHGHATDNSGNEYTIYASGPDISTPDTRAIAIPGGGAKA